MVMIALARDMENKTI